MWLQEWSWTHAHLAQPKLLVSPSPIPRPPAPAPPPPFHTPASTSFILVTCLSLLTLLYPNLYNSIQRMMICALPSIDLIGLLGVLLALPEWSSSHLASWTSFHRLQSSLRAFQSFVLQIRSKLSIQVILAAFLADYLTDRC